jgi:fatty acid kinase
MPPGVPAPTDGALTVPAHSDGKPREPPPAPILALDGDQLLAGLRGAATALASHEALINEFNVFPVPDGDTGSNMRLTFASALADAEQAAAPKRASSIMDAAAHGALIGARGNSGVILSQVIRGLAHGVDGRATVDAGTLGNAFGQATRVAYAAVINPIEGTILTVVRSSAAGVAAAARTSRDIRVVLAAGARAAYDAVDATIDQLPILHDAGVVDAGGFGFAVLLAGLCAAVTGIAVVPGPVLDALTRTERQQIATGPNGIQMEAARGAAAMPAREESWGFCTEFIIEQPRIATAALQSLLASEGDSLLVAGDEVRMRVHIHTDAPDEVIAMASRYGRVERIKVEDMSAQHDDVLARGVGASARESARRAAAVVPVAAGHGFVSILRSLGADPIVDGGQTMNPSTHELLSAVVAARAETVILLPNHGNIILAAERVHELAEEIDVRVVPTRNLPQGISALLSWDPGVDIDDCVGRMCAAAERTRALEITRAVRDARVGARDIRGGDVLAILDGEIAGHGAREDALIIQLLGGLAVLPEFVTIYHGAGIDPADAAYLLSSLESAHPTIGFELHDGGQDHYTYVLGLE